MSCLGYGSVAEAKLIHVLQWLAASHVSLSLCVGFYFPEKAPQNRSTVWGFVEASKPYHHHR